MQFDQLRRREFITLLGGAAAAWPVAALAQQGERMRRIGTLSGFGADDPEWQVRIAAFQHRLRQLGWIEGRNLRMDYRHSAGDPERGQTYAAELVALAPDVLLAGGGTSVPPLLRATRTVPVVFVNVPPILSGRHCRQSGAARRQYHRLYAVRVQFDREMARIAQGGRAGLEACGVLRDATITPGIGQFAVIQVGRAVARGGSEPHRRSRRAEIERAVTAFARSGNGGLIVSGSALALVHRDPIIALAASHKLPAIYSLASSSRLVV